MDLELSEDQQELARVAREVLERYAPPSLARAFLEGGGDAAGLWAALAELGWYGVGLAPDDPFGLGGLCLLAEQVGRHAAPTLLVDTAAVAHAVRVGDGATDPHWVQRLVGGHAPASLAILETQGTWPARGLGATAVEDAGGGYRVTGQKTGVHHAHAAGVFGVVALLDGEPRLFLVEAGAAGVTIGRRDGLDPASAPAPVTFDAAPVAAGAAVLEARAVDRALDIATVATAAEGVGAAGAALELAVAYALERQQYGRAIGGFQAVQHLLADLHVLRETAWSTILFAAAALEEDDADAAEAVSIAKAHASRAARTVVEGALQVFGGIGFTWEHDHHLFHRRALECEQRLGDAIHHERRLGDALARRTDDRIAY